VLIVIKINLCLLLMKEKEYKEALEAFNEKNKEKNQLIDKLMEVKFLFFFTLSIQCSHNPYEFITPLTLMCEQLVAESERLRMKKLEELSKTIDSLH